MIITFHRKILEETKKVQKMSNSLSNFIIYKGPSMNPTFKNADLLEVVPYDRRKIKRGDVITFMPLNSEISITHRVISVCEEGVRTLGDNNNNVDEGYVQPKDIVGCVIHARRNGRQLYIYNGMMGRIYSVIIRSIRRIKIMFRPIRVILRTIYLYTCRSGLFRKYIPLKTDLRIFSFSRPNGIELQLFWGNRIIGRLAPGALQWHIKPPYKLFVDVASLPKSEKDQMVDLSESES